MKPAFILAAMLSATCALAQKTDPVGEDKVVYHLSAGVEQAAIGLENIRNHLEVNPKAQIVVVALAGGVDFLLKGARTSRGNAYQQMVDDLEFRGVKFRVCEITMRERGLGKERFIEQAAFVPSGVAEITRLQQREGYAYLRP